MPDPIEKPGAAPPSSPSSSPPPPPPPLNAAQIEHILRYGGRADLGAPLAAAPGMTAFARLIGAVLGAFGLGLAALLPWGGWRRFQSGMGFGLDVLAVAFVPGLIAAWCLYTAWRLALMRPNRRGSLFTPRGWIALALVVGGIGGVTALLLLYQTLSAASVHAAPLLLTLFMLCATALFCQGCVQAARGAALPAAGPDDVDYDPAYDPGADRLRAPRRLEDIAAPQAWVQVHNDDATPMEFVVNAFTDVFGIDRQEALVLMLRIHRDGSAYVPCESEAQAREFAAQLDARAKGAGHPLACEARMELPVED